MAKDNDILIIDEFSQWGIESIDVLIKLIEYNHYAKVFFMGDILQIPTFLSSGSLLYSLMTQWPEKTEKKEKLYRFADPEMMLSIIKGEDIHPIVKKFSDSIEILRNVDCVITGSNEHVAMLDKVMISQKYKVDVTGLTLYDSIVKCLDSSSEDFSIIATSTFKLDDGTKIFTNERFDVSKTDYGLIAVSKVDKLKSIKLNSIMCNINFKAGYSITVNRSQGLEWPNTVVYMTSNDGNLMNHNAMYVALSRSKSNTILVTNEETKKEDDIDLDSFLFNTKKKKIEKPVTEADINRILKIGYKVENLFNNI